MEGGKGSLCCFGAAPVASLEFDELSMLLSTTAWHIALISSLAEASGPKQTHTQPARKTGGLK